MSNQALNLINTLIKKTKNDALRWKNLSISNVELKPERSNILDDNLLSANAALSTFIEHNRSYVMNYKDGYIFLLAHKHYGNASSILISLSVQTEQSKYSINYATTRDRDSEVASSLKRLYNIVDSYDYDISSFVNDFINH